MGRKYDYSFWIDLLRDFSTNVFQTLVSRAFWFLNDVGLQLSGSIFVRIAILLTYSTMRKEIYRCFNGNRVFCSHLHSAWNAFVT